MLPIRCVDSPNFFFAFSEMLMDMVIAIVNKFLPVPWYINIFKILKTGTVTPHTLKSLTYID